MFSCFSGRTQREPPEEDEATKGHVVCASVLMPHARHCHVICQYGIATGCGHPQAVVEDRCCRDVPFLLLFAGFWTGMIYIAYVGYTTGLQPIRPRMQHMHHTLAPMMTEPTCR